MNPTIATVCMGRRERNVRTSSVSASVRRLVTTSTALSRGVFSAGAISAIELSSVISILFRFGGWYWKSCREIRLMDLGLLLWGRLHALRIVAQSGGVSLRAITQ